MNKKEIWSFTHQGLAVEIAHWGIEREHNHKPLNEGMGCWNYYIYLPETQLGKLFDSIWLEDKLSKFTPVSPERVSHAYCDTSLFFNQVDWHGGITFYDKIGQQVGYRMVKVGCDFSHSFDIDRGIPYTLEEVVAEAQNTAKELMDYITLNK